MISREVGRGLGVADIDNDGDPDLAILNNGGPLQLLENNSPASPWVGIRVLDRLPNRQAIGARVTLTEDAIDRVGWVHAGASYQSSSDRRLRFRGLNRSSKNRQIEIRWSDGETASYPLPESALGRYLTVSRDEGIQLPAGEDRSLRLVLTFVGIALFGLTLWGLLRVKMKRSSS